MRNKILSLICFSLRVTPLTHCGDKGKTASGKKLAESIATPWPIGVGRLKNGFCLFAIQRGTDLVGKGARQWPSRSPKF